MGVAFAGEGIKRRQGPQIRIVGVEAVGRLAPRALHLRLLQAWNEGADHACGQLVLQGEDVAQLAVVTLRPNVRTRFCLNELAGNANTVARLAHTAFQHVAHAEFATDLFDVDRAPLVRERGIA